MQFTCSRLRVVLLAVLADDPAGMDLAGVDRHDAAGGHQHIRAAPDANPLRSMLVHPGTQPPNSRATRTRARRFSLGVPWGMPAFRMKRGVSANARHRARVSA